MHLTSLCDQVLTNVTGRRRVALAGPLAVHPVLTLIAIRHNTAGLLMHIYERHSIALPAITHGQVNQHSVRQKVLP